jgi:DNA mismatch repair protein MutS2
MEFDSGTLQPLYVMKIGLPGSSNALAISRRLGLKESILSEALSSLSEGAQAFEHIVRSAEDSRIEAEKVLLETNRLKAEWQEKIADVEREKEHLKKEREKLFTSAKAESRRIINERSADAEELLAEIEQIFAKEQLTESDLIAARTLKNRLGDLAYDTQKEELERPQYLPAQAESLKVGDKIYVSRIHDTGVIQSVRPQKGEAEVLCGNLRLRVKISELSILVGGSEQKGVAEKLPKWKKKQQQNTLPVQVSKSLAPKPMPSLEINIIGKTVLDAIPDVEAFIDAAVLANLEEVRIVHGMGTGKLRAGIHDYLRKCKNVAEFRLGRYGEGETGVTIVKIK